MNISDLTHLLPHSHKPPQHIFPKVQRFDWTIYLGRCKEGSQPSIVYMKIHSLMYLRGTLKILHLFISVENGRSFLSMTIYRPLQ
ncbi:hypothetical protein DsansV1_C24g0183021 [Dioscorea sansibarensis]